MTEVAHASKPARPPTLAESAADFLTLLVTALAALAGYWVVLYVSGSCAESFPGDDNVLKLLVLALGQGVGRQAAIVHGLALVVLLVLMLYRAFTGRRTLLWQQVRLLGWLMLPLPILLVGEYVCLLGIALMFMAEGRVLFREITPDEVTNWRIFFLSSGLILGLGYYTIRSVMVDLFSGDHEPLWPEIPAPPELPVGSTETPTRSSWQFSIAELLGLTTIVALCTVFPLALVLAIPAAIRTLTMLGTPAPASEDRWRVLRTFAYSLFVVAAIVVPAGYIWMVASGCNPTQGIHNGFKPSAADFLRGVSYIFALWLAGAATLLWRPFPDALPRSAAVSTQA